MSAGADVTGYPQYPDKELQDIQTANIVVFSLIIAALVVAVSLLLTILGCVFFSFRRNSCMFSKEKKKVKKEAKMSDLINSAALSKNQTALRFFAASKDDYDKKFEVLKYTTSKLPVEDDPKHNDNGDQLKKDVLATNTNDEVPIADGQSSVSPHLPQEVPEYTFPKHIVFELTQE